MLLYLKKFEKIIILALLVMMSLAILISTIELAVIMYEQLMEPPQFLLNIKEMLEIFGFFLMVLIGLELLETIKAYIETDKIHVEVVFLVAIIAIARKFIILDYKNVTPTMVLSMSAAILALSAGYFLLKRTLTGAYLWQSSEKNHSEMD